MDSRFIFVETPGGASEMKVTVPDIEGKVLPLSRRKQHSDNWVYDLTTYGDTGSQPHRSIDFKLSLNVSTGINPHYKRLESGYAAQLSSVSVRLGRPELDELPRSLRGEPLSFDWPSGQDPSARHVHVASVTFDVVATTDRSSQERIYGDTRSSGSGDILVTWSLPDKAVEAIKGATHLTGSIAVDAVTFPDGSIYWNVGESSRDSLNKDQYHQHCYQNVATPLWTYAGRNRAGTQAMGTSRRPKERPTAPRREVFDRDRQSLSTTFKGSRLKRARSPSSFSEGRLHSSRDPRESIDVRSREEPLSRGSSKAAPTWKRHHDSYVPSRERSRAA